MADFVEGVGPKVGKAFHKYLLFVKDTKMFLCYLVVFFDDFSNIQQVPEKRKECSVLVVEVLKILS